MFASNENIVVKVVFHEKYYNEPHAKIGVLGDFASCVKGEDDFNDLFGVAKVKRLVQKSSFVIGTPVYSFNKAV